jgi:hypothetical protein
VGNRSQVRGHQVAVTCDTYTFDHAREGSMRRAAGRFLLLVTLAAAAATPASGQVVAPVIDPANSGTQSAASVPDVSGTWVYPHCCGFAPPPSGPGPVLNKSRRPRPSLPGVPVSSTLEFIGDYTNPILKPAAAEVVKKHGELEASGLPTPHPAKPVLARRSAIHFCEFRHADAPATGHDYDSL